MKVRTRLFAFLIGFIILMAVFSLFIVGETQEIIQNQIGHESISFAESLMNDIDSVLKARVEEIEFLGQEKLLQDALQESNKKFELLENREAYIEQRNQEWVSSEKDEITKFMSSIIDNTLSEEFRKRIHFYRNSDSDTYFHEEGHFHDSDVVFSEIFVTNIYGANVAQSGKTSDYKQNDEEWWHEAKEKRVIIKDVSFDESAQVYSTDILIRVDDEQGNFIGIIKAVLNIKETISIIEAHSHEEERDQEEDQFTFKFKLITNDGKIIYSNSERYFNPLEDITNESFYKETKDNAKGYTITTNEEHKEVLLTYVTSKEHEDFEGLRWKLLLEIPTDEILAPLHHLRGLIFLIFLVTSTLGLITVGFISYSISRPIKNLSDVATEIGKGNLNIKTRWKSHDEFGLLAKTIDNTVVDLKRYQDQVLKGHEKHDKELELEVKKKTAELQRYITRLEKSRTTILSVMRDLKEGNQHLKDLDQAKSNFLNIVSHELKTPLTAIFAYLDIMDNSKKNFTKDQLMSFNAIRRNSDQLITLISNILEISRIQAGKFELIPIKLDVKQNIKDIVENLQPLAKNNGDTLTAKIGNIPKTIITDEQRFKEILNNLISNAIKFTENGKIVVEASRKGNYLLVRVKDNGVGIPKQKVNELFQKFYQVDASVSRKYGGTGLGLSITKQLVELQGGKIWVDSKEKKGSTFSFTLPIKAKAVKGGTNKKKK